MPVVLIMAITGAIYLLQPQIENALYKDFLYFQGNFFEKPNHDEIINATKKHFNAKNVVSYQAAIKPNKSAQVVLIDENKNKITVFVNPENLAVLGFVDEAWRLTNIARNIHKNLMLGNVGRVVTELVACWLIVIILSGIYLRLRSKKNNKFLLNLKNKKEKTLQEIHGFIGIWASIWLLLLLLSGLTWSFVWGGLLSNISNNFNEGFPQEIFSKRPISTSDSAAPEISMNKIFEIISQKNINHQFKIEYPWFEKGSYALMPLRHGGDAENVAYLFFDRKSGEILQQFYFQDLGKVGRLTSLGVAFHEGRLFGKLNQMLNLLAVFLLITLLATAFLMWKKRKKNQGAIKINDLEKSQKKLIFFAVLFALLFPLFGISIILIFLAEKFLKKSLKK